MDKHEAAEGGQGQKASETEQAQPQEQQEQRERNLACLDTILRSYTPEELRVARESIVVHPSDREAAIRRTMRMLLVLKKRVYGPQDTLRIEATDLVDAVAEADGAYEHTTPAAADFAPALSPCDTCGAPATHAARDMYVTDDPTSTSTVDRFQPGEMKAGCDAHPVESRTVDASLGGIIEITQRSPVGRHVSELAVPPAPTRRVLGRGLAEIEQAKREESSASRERDKRDMLFLIDVQGDPVACEIAERLFPRADRSPVPNPYPHEGGCSECMDRGLCNYCGVRIGSHCTNGRCDACHKSVCTSGGETEPGHGYGISGLPHYRDLHAETAAQLLDKPVEEVAPEERRAGKRANFLGMYGYRGSLDDLVGRRFDFKTGEGGIAVPECELPSATWQHPDGTRTFVGSPIHHPSFSLDAEAPVQDPLSVPHYVATRVDEESGQTYGIELPRTASRSPLEGLTQRAIDDFLGTGTHRTAALRGFLRFLTQEDLSTLLAECVVRLDGEHLQHTMRMLAPDDLQAVSWAAQGEASTRMLSAEVPEEAPEPVLVAFDEQASETSAASEASPETGNPLLEKDVQKAIGYIEAYPRSTENEAYLAARLERLEGWNSVYAGEVAQEAWARYYRESGPVSESEK